MKSILLTLSIVSLLVFANAHACDADSDCGAGGTCIKREKRARGVCYGGDLNRPADAAGAPSPAVDPLMSPTQRPPDACIVTEECPAGMECVITGIWGRCTVL